MVLGEKITVETLNVVFDCIWHNSDVFVIENKLNGNWTLEI